ncbi:hypothetical protein GCM10027413_20390 [Conyzicola nivalis]
MDATPEMIAHAQSGRGTCLIIATGVLKAKASLVCGGIVPGMPRNVGIALIG